MKKLDKKGFTLTEVIAVIVIIALLLAIAIPGIIKYMKKGKDKVNTNNEESLKITSEEYYGDHRGQLPNIGEYSLVLGTVLRENNYLTEDMKDADGGSCDKSYVVVENNNGKYIYHVCMVCDNYITTGDFCNTDKDPIKKGEKCTDKVNGCPPTCTISADSNNNWTNKAVNITINGNVNTNTKYPILYAQMYINNKSIGKTYKKTSTGYTYSFNKEGSYSLSSTDKIKGTIYDVGGYESKACTVTGSSTEIKIDKTAPTCTLAADAGYTANGKKITITASDKGGSGINGTYPQYVYMTSAGTKKVTVTDNAGNTGSCSITVAGTVVKYDANGGTGAPATQTKLKGQTINISSTIPTRTNYTFLGWNTKKDGTGTTYLSNQVYSSNNNLVLYAQWKLNDTEAPKCTISLDGTVGNGQWINGVHVQWYISNSTITVKYSDDVSGVSRIEYNIGNGNQGVNITPSLSGSKVVGSTSSAARIYAAVIDATGKSTRCDGDGGYGVDTKIPDIYVYANQGVSGLQSSSGTITSQTSLPYENRSIQSFSMYWKSSSAGSAAFDPITADCGVSGCKELEVRGCARDEEGTWQRTTWSTQFLQSYYNNNLGISGTKNYFKYDYRVCSVAGLCSDQNEIITGEHFYNGNTSNHGGCSTN